MSWSFPEAGKILEQFWHSGIASCPDDDGPLKLKLRKLLGGDYELFAECLVCGKNKGFRRVDDPRRVQFRSWTPTETEQLVKIVARYDRASCPVCGASVEGCDPAVAIPAPASIRCVRCGNSNQWQPFLTSSAKGKNGNPVPAEPLPEP
jgi:hypothetical protein